MNRRAFFIHSATYYAEKVQHNCLCAKRCYNDAHHETGHVRLKLGRRFVNTNYKKELEVREGEHKFPGIFLKNVFKIFEEGRDSSGGIATLYGLDGPGIESRWGGRDFPHPSRPALGPPSLLYNVYRVFPGDKVAGT